MIVGPDGAAWVTDGGLNAIVRVDDRTHRVRRFPLPTSSYANLNTATFDRRGILWFTGQSGIYGRVDPRTGRVRVLVGAARHRPVRDHDDAVGRGLLRVARRQPHRADRHANGPGDGDPAAAARPGRAARLVRLEGADLGERVERGQGRALRAADAPLARVASAGRKPAALCGLRGQPRRRLADGLRRERDRAVRPARRSGSGSCGCRRPGRRCASCSAVRASSGAPSRAPTSSWSSGPASGRCESGVSV